MTEPNQQIIKNIRESSGLRLAVLFGSFFIFLTFTAIIGSAIDGLHEGQPRTHLLITSTLQCLFAFCLPAFLLSKFSQKNWNDWLYLKKAPSLKQIIGVVIVYLLTMPAMEWLIAWNSDLHLPGSLEGLEATLRQMEDNAEAATQIILDTHGFGAILAGILVIGLLTGFSEELFFRGGFQGILMKSLKSKGLAVWVAALLFSIMHFQFFGFLPRLLMGAFFGYLLLWTRSIWVPIIAHALNNSMVVITAALSDQPYSAKENLSQTLCNENPAIVIGSFALSVIFFYLCKDFFFKNSSLWQKSPLPPVSEK